MIHMLITGVCRPTNQQKMICFGQYHGFAIIQRVVQTLPLISFFNSSSMIFPIEPSYRGQNCHAPVQAILFFSPRNQ